jgi:hypothetical protein
LDSFLGNLYSKLDQIPCYALYKIPIIQILKKLITKICASLNLESWHICESHGN